tara:strand:- start:80973 stop:81224 length:252 start_codon:yes stop_codon:yes gene_type:complete
MAQTSITSNVHQSLDVQVHFCSKITLYLILFGYNISYARYLLLIQISNSDGLIHSGFAEDLFAHGGTDPKNVGQSNHHSLISW